MAPAPRHSSPYPNGGGGGNYSDPRPWWFRDFEDRLQLRLDRFEAEVRGELGKVNARVWPLEQDRERRRGTVVTWRAIAATIVAVAALGTIIGLAAALIAGGGT